MGRYKAIYGHGAEFDERRALTAYYRDDGREHPDHSLTRHYFVAIKVKTSDGQPFYGYKKYVRLANDNGILAVFAINYLDEARRVKRWPWSVETGTALTEAELICKLRAENEAAKEERLERELQRFLDEIEEC